MKLARLAVPMAALALFAGCSTPTGGTAFEVAGQRVSMAQVEDAAAGCAGLVQQDSQALTGEVARMMLSGQLAEAVAEKTSTAVDPAKRSQALKQLQGEELLADEDCAVAVNGFADYAVINQELGQDKVRSAIKSLDVEVNPRFGGWDKARGTFSGTSGSLSMEDISSGEILGR